MVILSMEKVMGRRLKRVFGGSSEPDGLEVLGSLRLDSELLVDGRGEVRALPVLTVTDDDFVGLGLQGADVPHELLAVGVSGESVHGLPLHVDLEVDGLVRDADARAGLYPAADGSPGCRKRRAASAGC